jgi:hypothetical protein
MRLAEQAAAEARLQELEARLQEAEAHVQAPAFQQFAAAWRRAATACDDGEQLCRLMEATYWELQPLGPRCCRQVDVAGELGYHPDYLRKLWKARRGAWPPRGDLHPLDTR